MEGQKTYRYVGLPQHGRDPATGKDAQDRLEASFDATVEVNSPQNRRWGISPAQRQLNYSHGVRLGKSAVRFNDPLLFLAEKMHDMNQEY